MEAGLETRPQLDVDRTRRLYRGRCRVAEVAFVRAGSHGRAQPVPHFDPPPSTPSLPPSPAEPPQQPSASAEAESWT